MISNKIYIEGDSLIIEAKAPIVGLISLLDFVDTTIGEDNSNYFFKQYRISVDGGLNYSTWIELTKANLENETISPEDFFLIQYRYTKYGDGLEDIGFENISLYADKVSVSCPVEYNNSIFKQFFECDDVNVLQWCVNVTQKLYERGIVPSYIDRGTDDDDYIAFWSTVACFFAMIVTYGRQFQTFYNNPNLLIKYLESLDMKVCNTSDILSLKYYLINSSKILHSRGTLAIAKPKEENTANGELLQLICYKEGDEFILGLTHKSCNGWWVDKTSPLFKDVRCGIDKYYDNLEDSPLLNPSQITFVDENMVITNPSGGSGIWLDPNSGDDSKDIKISPNLDYEFNFTIRKQGSITYTWGFYAKNSSSVVIPSVNAILGNISSVFSTTSSLNQDDIDYTIKAKMLKTGTIPDSKYVLNTNEGNGLIMDSTLSNITPFIILYGNGTATISDVTIKPLGTDYEPNGYIDAKDNVEIWCINRSNLTEEALNEVISDKLLNYNQQLRLNIIE